MENILGDGIHMKHIKSLIMAAFLFCILALGGIAHAELKNLVLPAGLKIIGEEAFMNDISLDKVIVPEGVTQIQEKAFANSTVIEVDLPASITYIADNAFDGCDGLMISAPADSYAQKWVNSKGFKSLENATPASDFTYDVSGNEVTITGYIGSATEVVIPNFIEGRLVTGIAENAFNEQTELVKIDLPARLKSIGSKAFAGCSSLLSLKIPNSVTYLGSNIIRDDYALKYLQIGGGVEELDLRNTRIGIYREDTPALETVVINEGVKKIGHRLFSYYYNSANYSYENCYYPNLKSITLPQSLTTIGDMAFAYTGITELQLPSRLENIPVGLVSNCVNLKKVNIPAATISIEASAFEDCETLESITLPEGLESIGSSAFSGCASLKNISVPANVKSLGESAFEDCSGVTTITLREGLEKINSSAFRGCSSLQSLTIPNSVTYLGNNIIRDDNALKYLEIGGGVEELDLRNTRIGIYR